MTRLEALHNAKSIYDLSKLLGFKAKSISYFLYHSTEEKYYTFEIPKKNGEFRKIQAPTDKLKKLQSRLATLLSDCFEEIDRNQGYPNSLSHGFRRKHSIISNANLHKNKRYVFNIDLKDFFPTFNFGRVRGFFIKNKHFQLSPKIATIIAQIACFDNGLPQGSPCSPIITNLIAHLIDVRLVNLAKHAKCTYSRYADDITFSTNRKDFPKEIAYKTNANQWVVGNNLNAEITKLGFTINDKKTNMQYRMSRQVATGLIVNEKVNVKREYYKKARACCQLLFEIDDFYLSEGKSGSLNQLDGILNFIYQVKRPHDKENIGPRRFKPNAITKLYREFLSYRHFFSGDKPLIICEGKTDITYLKCALKRLHPDFNQLIEFKDGKTKHKVSFLRFSDRLKDVFAISEGTPGLTALMEMYADLLKRFKGVGLIHPVIIVLDTDSGNKEIRKKLEEKTYEFP
ncbi:MAG TPA: hypothetical protein DDX98_05890, partial [Bacteroidales bacterium]|nr:hypothetical protein [Bacteroidales bacterium]